VLGRQETLEELEDEICGWCGQGFDTTRTCQKFCCAECREASGIQFWSGIRKEERRRANRGKTCPTCRKTFDAAHGKQVYCSRACRVKESNKRRSAKVSCDRLEHRVSLRCVDCSGPITHARRSDAKRCRECLKAWTREIGRKHDRKRRNLL
jgi:hypothetical protein